MIFYYLYELIFYISLFLCFPIYIYIHIYVIFYCIYDMFLIYSVYTSTYHDIYTYSLIYIYIDILKPHLWRDQTDKNMDEKPYFEQTKSPTCFLVDPMWLSQVLRIAPSECGASKPSPPWRPWWATWVASMLWPGRPTTHLGIPGCLWMACLWMTNIRDW